MDNQALIEAWREILKRAEARYARIGREMRRYHLTGITETDTIIAMKLDKLGARQVKASNDIYDAVQEIRRLSL